LRLIKVDAAITTTKGNTISLGWPHLQRFTQYRAQYSYPLGQMLATYCTEKPHGCLVSRLLSCYCWTPAEYQWAPYLYWHIVIALHTGAKIFKSMGRHSGKIAGLHGALQVFTLVIPWLHGALQGSTLVIPWSPPGVNTGHTENVSKFPTSFAWSSSDVSNPTNCFV